MRYQVAAWALAGVCACAGASWAKSKAGAKGHDKVVAQADIEPKSGSKLKGTATFTAAKDNALTLHVKLSDLPPGQHAIHIHDKGDCSAPDGASAGPHWNPTSQPHGKWDGTPHHLGDIGNLEVKPDGTAELTMTTDKWSVTTGAPNDILGHALVIHGGVDDFTSQPAGNAGSRVGCGVISAPAASK